jgi:hypothetical protein
MPPVIDTPNYDHVAAPTLDREWPQARRARLGFWRFLVQGITAYLTATPRAWHAPSGSTYCPFEPPMDRLVREYPSLSILALAII